MVKASCLAAVPMLTIALLVGCAPVPRTSDQTRPYCAGNGLLVDGNFDGAGFDSCSFTGPARVEILVGPEDAPPINPSPWYAFRLSATRPVTVDVTIRIEHGPARYWPWLSSHGKRWRRARADEAVIADGDGIIQLALAVTPPGLWVAAQEIVDGDDHFEWISRIAAFEDVETRLIGHSVNGRPIYATETPRRDEAILLLGRQHPPEVSGAWALQSFATTLLADTDLARQFREHYMVIAVPLLNPDGVAAGHWRHNAAGVDLNRDWGPFTQPETRAVRDWLTHLQDRDIRPAVMLDFHSTRESLLYTQRPEETGWPFDFATLWLQRSRTRLGQFEIRHEPRARAAQVNAKNYFFDRYGIPAITYEMADEATREGVTSTARILAEEAMRLLLRKLSWDTSYPLTGTRPCRNSGISEPQ